MPQLDEIVGDVTSVRVTNDDHENAEIVGYEQKPPSTVLTRSLEDSVKLQTLREEKKEELVSKILDIRDECQKWDIDYSELI